MSEGLHLHQWTTFQKGKTKIQACACCGQMKFASNLKGGCDDKDLLSSPIIKSGYRLAKELPYAQRRVA